MTKKEAIAEMEKGVKITHECFTKDEWMIIKDKKIQFEDGMTLTPTVFWNYRQNKIWNSNYSIYVA